jgi:hypothetical protein
MRTPILIVILTVVVLGCARSGQAPVAPDTNSSGSVRQSSQTNDGPYRLWWEGTFYVNSAHDAVDVVPKRQSRFHLNTAKFLEEYCSDCLQIVKISKNGDGTIDLDVRIAHPFESHPEYTGFDVKGIIMFTGSYDLVWDKYYYIHPHANQVRLSWSQAGDPEVLNPDGFTGRWCPSWNSGSSLPIFNYWPGKYSNGTPTADINAYLSFYTDEERHMFRCNSSIQRTYHIFLPTGPVVAGYAVEACWEPPIVTPVTDPANDFPYSANQPEPYYFKTAINNGEVIKSYCCHGSDCSQVWIAARQWYGSKLTDVMMSLPPYPGGSKQGFHFQDCPSEPPDEDHYSLQLDLVLSEYPDGTYRGLSWAFLADWMQNPYCTNIVYDVFDFTVDMQ